MSGRNKIRQFGFLNSEYNAEYFPEYDFVVPQYVGNTYQLNTLSILNPDYWYVMSKLNVGIFDVISIEKVENKFLKRCFDLKKIQKEELFGLKEMELFHSTLPSSTHEICKHNFNWRKFGTRTKHHSYGQGVYFSENAEYSRKYLRDLDGDKVMFLAEVLIGNTCAGNKRMKIPPLGKDASVKSINNYEEVVKYNDNEFYPSYKITFRFTETHKIQLGLKRITLKVNKTFSGESSNTSENFSSEDEVDYDSDSESNTAIDLAVTGVAFGAALLKTFFFNKDE